MEVETLSGLRRNGAESKGKKNKRKKPIVNGNYSVKGERIQV